MNGSRDNRQPNGKSSKKYSKPNLVNYGLISTLAKGQTGSGFDGTYCNGPGNQNRPPIPCTIREE